MIVLMHVFSGNLYAVEPSEQPKPVVEVAEPTLVVEPVAQATTQTYEATAYTAYCSTGCIGITASGYDVSNTIYTTDGLRIIATDKAQIPMYSIVDVTLADGTTFKAQALDTGGAIRGNRIDILVASRDEAMRLGRQDVEIEIIRRGDGK